MQAMQWAHRDIFFVGNVPNKRAECMCMPFNSPFLEARLHKEQKLLLNIIHSVQFQLFDSAAL